VSHLSPLRSSDAAGMCSGMEPCGYVHVRFGPRMRRRRCTAKTAAESRDSPDYVRRWRTPPLSRSGSKRA